VARTTFAILIVTLANCISSHSAAGKDSSPATAPATAPTTQPVTQSINGVIKAVDDQTLTVTVEDGKEQRFTIDSRTAITHVFYVCLPAGPRATARKRIDEPASQSDLKAGQDVVITAEEKDQRATKVGIR